jgi:hypothetical protein
MTCGIRTAYADLYKRLGLSWEDSFAEGGERHGTYRRRDIRRADVAYVLDAALGPPRGRLLLDEAHGRGVLFGGQGGVGVGLRSAGASRTRAAAQLSTQYGMYGRIRSQRALLFALALGARCERGPDMRAGVQVMAVSSKVAGLGAGRSIQPSEIGAVTEDDGCEATDKAGDAGSRLMFRST